MLQANCIIVRLYGGRLAHLTPCRTAIVVGCVSASSIPAVSAPDGFVVADHDPYTCAGWGGGGCELKWDGLVDLPPPFQRIGRGGAGDGIRTRDSLLGRQRF